jgi:Na+-translocating ferredoxin:NAD+ oxidoreductase RnfD subunit
VKTPGEPGHRSHPRVASLRSAFPPARLLWIALVVLGVFASSYLGGIGALGLLVLPLVAVLTDLAFARVRFERLRVPDAAIATGLFLALILPPTAPLLLTGTTAFAAVALRHLLRWRGHPWFNPAAAGVLFCAIAFGLAPAWWEGAGPYAEYLTVALGGMLIALGASRWRLPASFLVTYAAMSAIQHVLLGATTDVSVLVLQAADPTVLFLALFMVAEPRTAPTPAPAQTVFGASVGLLAAFAPLAFPTVGLVLALLGGNLLALVLRARAVPLEVTLPSPARRARPVRSGARPRPLPPRWSVLRRAGAGLLVVIVLVGIVAAAPGTPRAVLLATGPPAPGGTLTGCSADNPSIPASTLQQLHHMLGPSVIRSYDAGTGVVVFYDPVNHVTVTETDLYEDFGFAEFNGDDYAVSGCAA